MSKTDKEIEAKELTADIYSESLEPQIRGVLAFDKHPHMRIGKPLNL